MINENTESKMNANVGGMVSWGLDTDNLSADYKLNKLI